MTALICWHGGAWWRNRNENLKQKTAAVENLFGRKIFWTKLNWKKLTRWWFHLFFHPYLGKWSNFTNIFQLGWKHQLVNGWKLTKFLRKLFWPTILRRFVTLNWWECKGMLQKALQNVGCPQQNPDKWVVGTCWNMQVLQPTKSMGPPTTFILRSLKLT